jgi:hypothetical protein
MAAVAKLIDTLEVAIGDRGSIVSLLTLDFTRAFYDLVGLDPRFHDVLHRTLRETTLITRKELMQALVDGTPAPTLATFCSHIETSAGRAATEHLAWWLQYIHNRDSKPLDHWLDLFRHTEREGAWSKLPLPKELSAEVWQRFISFMDRGEYNRRCEEIEDRPLSDWDLHLSANQPFDFEDDVEGGSSNPALDISLWSYAYRGYRFSAWLLRTLSPEQETKLLEVGTELVRTLELTWIKTLVHPSELDIGL